MISMRVVRWTAGCTGCSTAATGRRPRADTSFGAHIYNIPLTYCDEPSSY